MNKNLYISCAIVSAGLLIWFTVRFENPCLGAIVSQNWLISHSINLLLHLGLIFMPWDLTISMVESARMLVTLCLFTPVVLALFTRLPIWNAAMSSETIHSLPINECDGHMVWVFHEANLMAIVSTNMATSNRTVKLWLMAISVWGNTGPHFFLKPSPPIEILGMMSVNARLFFRVCSLVGAYIAWAVGSNHVSSLRAAMPCTDVDSRNAHVTTLPSDKLTNATPTAGTH